MGYPDIFPDIPAVHVLGPYIPPTEEANDLFSWRFDLKPEHEFRDVNVDRLRRAGGPYRRNMITGEDWSYEILSDKQLAYLNHPLISRSTSPSLVSEVGILDMYLEDEKPVLVMGHATGGPGVIFGFLMNGHNHTRALDVLPKADEKDEEKAAHVDIPQYLDDRLKDGIKREQGFVWEYDLEDGGKVYVAFYFPNPFGRMRDPSIDYHP